MNSAICFLADYTSNRGVITYKTCCIFSAYKKRKVVVEYQKQTDRKKYGKENHIQTSLRA